MMRAVVLTLLLATCGAYAQEPAGFDPHVGARLPGSLELTDASGAPRRLDSLFGKPTLLVFAYYTCPQLCGVVLAGLADGLRGITPLAGRDFSVVVVSFDPHDTPALAAAQQKKYTDRYGRNAGAGWHFLTGGPAQVRALTAAAGFRYRFDAAQRRFVHPAGVIVLAPDGSIRAYLEGAAFTPQTLRDALAGIAVPHTLTTFQLFCGAIAGAIGTRTRAVLLVLQLVIVVFLGTLAWLGWRLHRRGSA